MNGSIKKKTNKKVSTLVEGLNASVRAKADANRVALADLRRSVPELEEAAEVAELAPDDIVCRWEAGDADVPVEEYLHAEASYKKAQALAQGAKRRLSALERKTPNTSLAVAEVAASALEVALPGVPVYTALALPSETPRDSDLPCVIVAQVKPTVRDGSGSISGEAWPSTTVRPSIASYAPSPWRLPVARSG